MRNLRLLSSFLVGVCLGLLASPCLRGTAVSSGRMDMGGWKQHSPGPVWCTEPGVYGSLGTPAPGNTPGGREYALSWTDSNGNLWLFGGLLFSTQENYFNDLWKFDPATGQWAWMSGSSTVGSNCVASCRPPNCGRSGTYGTLGTPAAGNTPGGRYQSETWVDSSGNFWLYGGLGFDANGNWGALSDLGGSILRRTSGPGWAEAAQYR